MLYLITFFVLFSNSQTTIDKFFLDEAFKDTEISFSVIDKKGDKLVGINPEKSLNQASVSKLIITLAALKELTLGFRFKTDFYTSVELPKNGILDGDLIIKSYGDPNLETEDLYKIVDDLKLRGLKEIKGKIIFDFSFFDKNQNIYTLKYEDDSRSYAALNSVAPLNYNAFKFSITPAEKEDELANITLLHPISRLIDIKNELKTTNKRSSFKIETDPLKNGKTELKIVGRVNINSKPMVFYRKIHNPDAVFTSTLRYILITSGIKVKKKNQIVYDNTLNYDNFTEFYTFYTRNILDTLILMNRYSNNFIAEQLLKIIGKTDEKSASWEEGIKKVKNILNNDVKLKENSYNYVNASGLNDANFFSSEQMTKILQYIYNNFDYKWYVLSTLPKMGISGTMRRYCLSNDCKGNIIAKTGSLRSTVSLAGFLKGEKDIYIFSLSVAFEPSKKRFKEILQKTKEIFNDVIDNGEL
ncbi:D-alanyl-D-alanine carboxypeptidase/D-alanyl-D-alanine-endopeptidase [bacterium]|nr:D-alanyl-D-alanine carboxypeptidase/D-alanyl-D-alanine-endopeptidase [bacterium]